MPCFSHALRELYIDFHTSDGMLFHAKADDNKHIRWIKAENNKRYYKVILESIPTQFYGKNVDFEIVKINEFKIQGEFHQFEEPSESIDLSIVRNVYYNEFQQIENIMSYFKGIDIKKELLYFSQTPDLIEKVIPALNNAMQAEEKILPIKEDGFISFNVKATYDKKYYCAAKISDKAVEIIPASDEPAFNVTFRFCQIAEIELMSYMFYDAEKEEDNKIREFLNIHSKTFYVINCMKKCQEELGFSSFVNNSVVVSIIKLENRKMQDRIDRVYSNVVQEHRVPTRWGNEYKLFSLLSIFRKDAIYQYRSSWLGQQSLDIYLEQVRIGIEYQGIQHYTPVERFGGEEALMNNQKRDARKKALCAENGVRLIEWPYLVEVNIDNVRQLMIENNIEIQENNNQLVRTSSIMAPIIQEKPIAEKSSHGKERTKTVKSYIVQYDLDGQYVECFSTLAQAAEMVGTTNTSISKVLKGERNTAANYVWRKYNVEDRIPECIEINFDVSKINDGKARRIAYLDDTGNIKREFASIIEAARETGISQKSIKSALSKSKSSKWMYL